LTAQCSTHSDILSLVVFLSQLKACSHYSSRNENPAWSREPR
jgi:hypothetical protein